jgi:hypothetical protein
MDIREVDFDTWLRLMALAAPAHGLRLMALAAPARWLPDVICTVTVQVTTNENETQFYADISDVMWYLVYDASVQVLGRKVFGLGAVVIILRPCRQMLDVQGTLLRSPFSIIRPLAFRRDLHGLLWR